MQTQESFSFRSPCGQWPTLKEIRQYWKKLSLRSCVEGASIGFLIGCEAQIKKVGVFFRTVFQAHDRKLNLLAILLFFEDAQGADLSKTSLASANAGVAAIFPAI